MECDWNLFFNFNLITICDSYILFYIVYIDCVVTLSVRFEHTFNVPFTPVINELYR